MDVYSPKEIALAVGVSEAELWHVWGRESIGSQSNARPRYLPHADAVRIGRLLVARRASDRRPRSDESLFSVVSSGAAAARATRLPIALSSTLHIGIIAAAVFITTLGLTPASATHVIDESAAEPMRLVFLSTPGPGGGGGGGGLQQKARPPKAEREGHRAMSSPLPARTPPRPIEPVPAPPEPTPPPLNAEQLPVVVAPIVTAPADTRNRVGVLDQSTSDSDSHGPGKGGGTGTGTGTGVGQGDGSGIGPGSGGGIGGGPYRPGSGIDPPRLVREVRADYTEEARQRGITGEVVLEIVVVHDGSVGDVKVLQGLGGGLNERAVQAVRQWRFTPARRLGAPVDVIVEVSVEFKLR